MMRFTIPSLILILILISCENDETVVDDFQLGKNYFTTTVDGDMREYYVHVPSSYSSETETPVVLMLHGGSGTGAHTYNNSGWQQIGDEEGILTVFPTAWSYCWIKASGQVKDTTRWNSFPGIFEFCQGEVPRDDVKFLRQIIDELKQKFNVDDRRIYMSGFSSGGQMGFRCGVEMNDILAAIVQSGGTHQVDTVFDPARKPPMAFEVGNSDPTWFDRPYPPIQFMDTLLKEFHLFRKVARAHIRTFDYDTSYVLNEIPGVLASASFPPIPNSDQREFVMTMVKDLEHKYPNGVNHPFFGARHHWEWMKQFSLE